MNNDATVNALIARLHNEIANSRRWQSKAALQAREINRLNEVVKRLRSDKLKLLADLKKIERMEEALLDMVGLFSADDMLLKGTHLHAALKRARAALKGTKQ
jgi:hypothetical protein